MFAQGLLAGLALVATAPVPQAENCAAAGQDARGEPWSTPVRLELAGEEKLDPAALPEGTSGIACPRASLVPVPHDIRVLTELGVSLGLVEEGGRALWIWSRDGLLRTTVDNGELSPDEVAALIRWTEAAQERFQSCAAGR